jgi:hypothetical protein
MSLSGLGSGGVLGYAFPHSTSVPWNQTLACRYGAGISDSFFEVSVRMLLFRHCFMARLAQDSQIVLVMMASPDTVLTFAGGQVVYVYVNVFEKLFAYLTLVESVNTFQSALGVGPPMVVGDLFRMVPATVFALPPHQFFTAPTFPCFRLELTGHHQSTRLHRPRSTGLSAATSF